VLERLHDEGIRIALDDFGAGSTSLSHLAELPLDEIKIDRSFVSAVVDDADVRAIVRSIVELSHELGLEVVAEGVETPAAHDALRALGCDLFQGFHFGRPLPAEELAAWLDAGPDAARCAA
jgi:EAL domain-containing protein (putative c-di-GMP-specific phosphodiesterase class I)